MEKLLTLPLRGPGEVIGERRPRRLSSTKALRRTGAFLLASGLTLNGCASDGGQEVQVQRAVNEGPAAPGTSNTPEKPKQTKPKDGGKIPMEIRLAALEKCERHPELVNVHSQLGTDAIYACQAEGGAVITYSKDGKMLVEGHGSPKKFEWGMGALCVGKNLEIFSYGAIPSRTSDRSKVCDDGEVTLKEIEDDNAGLPFAATN